MARVCVFDINETLGEPKENVAGYAVCYLLSDDEQKDVTLLMGSNDQGKIYLNGTEVVKFESGRGIDKLLPAVDRTLDEAEPDQEAVVGGPGPEGTGAAVAPGAGRGGVRGEHARPSVLGPVRGARG
jgi:hypothetical protein